MSNFRFTSWADNKVMVGDLGNTLLSVLYGLTFHQVSLVTPKQCYITSCPPAEIHLSMLEGEASIIQQFGLKLPWGSHEMLWEEKPAFRHSLSYQCRDTDRSRRAPHFSFFCSSLLPNLPFLSTFLFCVNNLPYNDSFYRFSHA